MASLLVNWQNLYLEFDEGNNANTAAIRHLSEAQKLRLPPPTRLIQ
jgi:hypothetical protein